jgi:glutathione S-transferase
VTGRLVLFIFCLGEMKASLVLTYFGVRGSCDKIRLLMAQGNLNYTEVIITGREFASAKKDFEFEQLPMLEDGQLRIVTACAITRHVARKLNLYGSTFEEAALCDMWMAQCEEVQQSLWNAEFMQKDLPEHTSKQMKEQYLSKTLAPQLQLMSNVMAKNQTMFLVGKKLTFVDIVLFSLLDCIDRELPLALPAFPLLAYFHSSIKELPRIKAFCASGRRF